jgi:hypothetical protein
MGILSLVGVTAAGTVDADGICGIEGTPAGLEFFSRDDDGSCDISEGMVSLAGAVATGSAQTNNRFCGAHATQDEVTFYEPDDDGTCSIAKGMIILAGICN